MEFHRTHPVLVQIKNPTSIYFKIMKMLYQTMRIFCCLDLGYFEFKTNKQRIFWNFVSLIQSTVMCCVCLIAINNVNSNYTAGCALYLIHYYLYVVILLKLDSRKSICGFYKDLEIIDAKIRVNNESYNLEKILFLTCIFDMFYTNLTKIVYCYVDHICLRPLIILPIYWILITAFNLIYFLYTFVFYALNCRLKKLETILDTTNIDYTHLQDIYKSIVEVAEMNKSTFAPMLILAIIFNTIKFMTLTYGIVQQFIKQNVLMTRASPYFIVAEALVLTFIPAISAGMLPTQANKLKVALHHKLMEEKDSTKIAEIYRFIQYVDERGCRFRVWKVIPFDADLLKLVLNFSVTYLIVIIQFTI